MDRKLFYAGQVPLSSIFLQSEQQKMIGLAYLAEAAFGQATLVDGLICAPVVPASLTVQVGPGHIWQLENIDGTAFGSLPVNTHNIMKQGINLDAVQFTLTPPVVAGQAVNYLIQAQIQETDADNLALPYVNSANPQVPFTGPNNSGAQQPTTRKCTVLLSTKAGTAATAGTQTTPAPDAGYVGLYSVTVAYGATTLDSSTITQLDTAPFLFKKLPELPRWVQSGEYLWGSDTGSANAIVTKLTPLPLAYKKGMHVFVKKMNAANTGNVTINCNGLGAVAVLDITGAQIGSGNLAANLVMHLVYDGTSFRWINGSITNTTISSPYPVSLNFPGLSSDVPSALDVFAFYDHESAHHRNIQWQTLLGLISGNVAGGLLNIQILTDTGTYTKTTGAKKALVIGTGSGAAGGSCGSTWGGGGAAATVLAFIDVSGVTSVAVTIGAPGTPGPNSFGGNGGDLVFGGYFTAGGGKGGGVRGNFGGGDTNGAGGPPGAASLGAMPCILSMLLGGQAGGAGGPIDGGLGGSSFWGGGGRPGDHNFYGPAGGPGLAPGAGGGGSDGVSSQLGGAGAKGVAFIMEFT